MSEDALVTKVLASLQDSLRRPYFVKRGASLLYQVTVNNKLAVTVDPRTPARGHSAFQTDLCVFHNRRNGVVLPRVVLEFKSSVTTHDVLTYSTKARRHKQVYPYLRYGLISSIERVIPRRFFTHNEGLDFFVALGGFRSAAISPLVARAVRAELRASRQLEEFAFGNLTARVYRSQPKAGR